MEIAKAYDPKEAEQNHYDRWETSGFFTPEINQDPAAEPFSIVIPRARVRGGPIDTDTAHSPQGAAGE